MKTSHETPKKVLILGDSFCSGVNNLLPLNGRVSMWFVISRLAIGFFAYLPPALILGILISPKLEKLRQFFGVKSQQVRKLKWLNQYLFWHFNQVAFSKRSINAFSTLIAYLKQKHGDRIHITEDAGTYRFIVGLTQEKLDKYFSQQKYDYILIFLGINDIGQCVPKDEIEKAIQRLGATIKAKCPQAIVAFIKQPNMDYHMTSAKMLKQSYIHLPFGLSMTPAQCDEFFGGLNNSPIYKNNTDETRKRAIDEMISFVDMSYESCFEKHGLNYFAIETYYDNPDKIDGYTDLFAFDCLHPNEKGYAEIYGKNAIRALDDLLQAKPGKISNISARQG